MEKVVHVAEVYQRCWLEDSGQWLENVNRNHLILERLDQLQLILLRLSGFGLAEQHLDSETRNQSSTNNLNLTPDLIYSGVANFSF